MTTPSPASLFGGWKEDLTGLLAQISSDHAYIHLGKAFSIAIDLGSINGAYHVALTTPAAASGYIHYRQMSVGITTSANSCEFLMRGPITSYTGGSTYTPFNRNFNSSATTACVVKYGVTPTVGSAILIDNMQIGSSGNPNARSGGAGGGNDEIVLAPASIYLFTFTTGGATEVSFNCFWYEEERGI